MKYKIQMFDKQNLKYLLVEYNCYVNCYNCLTLNTTQLLSSSEGGGGGGSCGAQQGSQTGVYSETGESG